MKRLSLAVAVCGLALPAFAQDVSTRQPEMEKSCGQKIKEDAKYPLQLKTTVVAVADMMDAHAKWIGNKTPEAKAESQALMKLARQHRDLAKQADRAATSMQAMGSLPEATHDMKNVPSTLVTAMERVRDEQRRFGNLLVQGADEMDQQINNMRGVGGAGMEGSEPTDVEPMPSPSDPFPTVPPPTDPESQPQPQPMP